MKRLQTEFLLGDSELTKENYYEMLEIVPPRMITSNAFLVGEPDDHSGEGGAARYGLYFTKDCKYYYGGKTTVKEFMMFLVEDRPVPGRLYALTGGKDVKCIMNGNSWSDSVVRCPVCDKPFVDGTCADCDLLVKNL